MLLYLLAIIICFLLDTKFRDNKVLYFIGCAFVICFFCFGYMVGSDWRQYERDYEYDYYQWYALSGEYGSYLVFKFFKSIGMDFWLFTGLCKVIYFLSILYMASCFTERKWAVMGVYTITGGLLAMVIGCPFRMMLGVMVANFAIIMYMKGRRIFASILLLLACTFHSTFIVAAVLLLSYFLFYKMVNDISSRWYILLYVVLYCVILFTPIFDFIYGSVIPFFDLSELADSYERDDLQNFFTIGNLKEFLLFIVLLVFREDVLKLKNGKMLFYFSILSAFGFLLFKCIPVGSRFNIINKFFYAIVFAQILYSKVSAGSRLLFMRSALVILLLSTFYNIYSSYMFIPYSNSIPYIITEHKPFDERANYNYIEYNKRIGKKFNTD